MDDDRALTALTDIRSLELEMALRLDAARTEADEVIARAQREASRQVADARERGAQQAEDRHRQRVAAARAEAAGIRQAGREEAAALLGELRPRLIDEIPEMLGIIVATVREEDG